MLERIIEAAEREALKKSARRHKGQDAYYDKKLRLKQVTRQRCDESTDTSLAARLNLELRVIIKIPTLAAA